MFKITSDIFLIKKENIARVLFYIGILTAYWGSLMPWFVWKIEKVYFILAAFPIILSILISRTLSEPIFCRRDFQLPIISFLALSILMRLVNGNNINAYIGLVFYAIIFLSLFILKIDEIQKLIKFICVVMALLLTVSIPFFFLYLIGFPLPSSSLVHEELMYSYNNYYFFLIDDRSFFFLLPRFNSVFMEPGHLGTACVLLLMTQTGKWKKWYNIILIITTIMTFSLAAFVLFVLIIFANAWIKRRHFLSKVIVLITLVAGTTVGAIFYNDGDNMLNLLIVERLEVNDEGELSGDNRVTDSFETAFNDFIKTDDIIFGRDYELAEFGWGNAGYRVFIYDYGIICLLLVIVFYLCSVFNCGHPRTIIAMFVIGVASFWVRATPLSFYYFIPMYAFTYMVSDAKKAELDTSLKTEIKDER